MRRARNRYKQWQKKAEKADAAMAQATVELEKIELDMQKALDAAKAKLEQAKHTSAEVHVEFEKARAEYAKFEEAGRPSALESGTVTIGVHCG